MSEALLARARAWCDADPDPQTRAELERLIEQQDEAELADRFRAELDFGTAGLRGAVGAGPARMNRAVVMRAVRALAEHLLAKAPDARVLPVVVGYDARPQSQEFAEAAAGVLLAAGLSVRWFEAPAPTPLVAYAARTCGAVAALVVTASHNPRGDNGLKVYGPDARQLVAPDDVDVARRRDSVGSAASIPCVDAPRVRAGQGSARLELVPDLLAARYLDEVEALLPPRRKAPKLRVVYTPIHGVGRELAMHALARRGFVDVQVVAEQAEPDGTFPTAAFPNPELDGVLDLGLALAQQTNADLLLANDPDADRLAAAVRGSGGQLRVLSGNEIALLLADFVLSRVEASARALLVTSVVSTPLLATLAAARGARAEITLTGFKWIWHAARSLEAQGGLRYAFGCEEALGYSIGGVVRDKDGISALLWLAELAEECRERGQTLQARLLELCERHGVWQSAQVSRENPPSTGAELTRQQLDQLAQGELKVIVGLKVVAINDYRVGAEQRPPWLGSSALVELSLDGQSRVLVRPSGTEPKLKIYADAHVTARAEERLPDTVERAQRLAKALAEEVAAWLGKV
ncbi:MAG: phospho-sugar mutase [Polyangiaceae bacterium]